MKIYKESKKTILLSQYKDPLLDHLYSKVIFHLKKTKSKKVLDVGCGAGKIISLIKDNDYEIIGVEIDNKAYLIAKENAGNKKNCKIILGDILNIKLKNEYFDAVICSEVIEHTDKPDLIIDKISALLKKDGILILTTPHDKCLWTVLDEYAEHKKRYEINEIRDLLKKFKIIDLYTVGFPFMAVFFIFYNLFCKLLRIKHRGGWRDSNISAIYYYLFGLLLKIDDMFNELKLGTNIIIVVQKI